jgi:hypothetical protein
MVTPAARAVNLPGGKLLSGHGVSSVQLDFLSISIEIPASLGMKFFGAFIWFIQQFTSFFDPIIHCFAFNFAILDFMVAVFTTGVFCKSRLVASTSKRHQIDSVVFSFLAVVRLDTHIDQGRAGSSMRCVPRRIGHLFP